MFGPDTAGTSTSGLQEALNVTTNRPGTQTGVQIQLMGGYYFYTNALYWSNFQTYATLRMDGQSWYSTRLVYAGTDTGTNCITIAGSHDITYPLNAVIKNVGFTAITSTNNTLLKITHLTTCTIEECGFVGHTNALPAVVGLTLPKPNLVGLVAGEVGDDIFILRDCNFTWLATGVDCGSDHFNGYSLKFDNIGEDSAHAVGTFRPATSYYSLGAGIVRHVALDSKLIGAHFYDCAVGYAALCDTTFVDTGALASDIQHICYVDWENCAKPLAVDQPTQVIFSIDDGFSSDITVAGLAIAGVPINAGSTFAQYWVSNSPNFGLIATNLAGVKFVTREDVTGYGTNHTFSLPFIVPGLHVGSVTTFTPLLTNIVVTNVTLDFPATATLTSSDLQVAFQNVKSNDVITVIAPYLSQTNCGTYTALFSNTTAYARFNNWKATTVDPPPGSFVLKVEEYK